MLVLVYGLIERLADTFNLERVARTRRDRALIATLTFNFARITSALRM
jgi:hypothetical protein